MVAGLLSTFGFAVLQPILEKHTIVRDTCGVHNLHGMPVCEPFYHDISD